MKGSTVALCVTGSIAAYKAAELARLLIASDAKVIPVMTKSAARFLGPVTLAGLCGEPVATDMWSESFAGEMHVALAQRADVVAIVPATADVLSRLAHGRADDLVTALALCARGPVVAAPAMHPRMWQHPATQGNVADLASQGRVRLIGPVHGEVASGETGVGRMAEPKEIAAVIASLLVPGDLSGRRVVVTAGPTFEDIDPVRFLGNRSSGRMGFAIAERAAARGADVTLIAGPVSLQTPHGVRRTDVRSAADMRAALRLALGEGSSDVDALVMSAAVADYRPARSREAKIKRTQEGMTIDLAANPDLLAEIGAARTGRTPVLVGFALETSGGEALVESARRKLGEKRVDLVVANEASTSIGRDDNRATLVSADGVTALSTMTKAQLADVLLDWVRRALAGRATPVEHAN